MLDHYLSSEHDTRTRRRNWQAVIVLFLLIPGCNRASQSQQQVEVDPSLVEFRPIATERRFPALVKAAEEQQAAELRAGKPLSREVRRTKQDSAPTGLWVDIVPRTVEWMKTLQGARIREIRPPEAAGSTESTWQVLVFLDPLNVNRADIDYAAPTYDSNDRPCVEFTMTRPGAAKLERLTAAHLPSGNDFCHLGIIVAGQLYSAPRINSIISSDGLITGDFTQDEVRDIAAIMTAVKPTGAYPTATPTSTPSSP
ncbi:MAG: hypothetical protein JNL96_21000 [Planctomycetaceae bacterium]|nr:hypothetical protein [Planctomycetaceae bacterium]